MSYSTGQILLSSALNCVNCMCIKELLLTIINSAYYISLNLLSGIFDMNKNLSCKISPIVFGQIYTEFIAKIQRTNINTTENCF